MVDNRVPIGPSGPGVIEGLGRIAGDITVTDVTVVTDDAKDAVVSLD